MNLTENPSFQAQRIQNLAAYNQNFQQEKVYPFIIWKNDKKKYRLTQGLHSYFSKGFVLKEGEAEFPTYFALKRKKWVINDIKSYYTNPNDAEWLLVFEGHIIDCDNQKYIMSIEDIGNNVKKMGYNEMGEKVYLFFNEPGYCIMIIENEGNMNRYLLDFVNNQTNLKKIVPSDDTFNHYTDIFHCDFSLKSVSVNYDFNKMTLLESFYGEKTSQFKSLSQNQMETMKNLGDNLN